MTEIQSENGRTVVIGAPELFSQTRTGNLQSSTHQDIATHTTTKVPSLDVKQAETFLAAGFQLFRLNPFDAVGEDAKGRLKRLGKMPLRRGWQTERPLDAGSLRRHMNSRGNVGIRLDHEHFVIDVDLRNGGKESYARLMQAFPQPDAPVVVTGTDGYHIFLRKPADLEIVGGLQGYPGLDFKKKGGYVVAAGSVHPDTEQTYHLDPLSDFTDLSAIPMASQQLLDLLAVRPRVASDEDMECSPEQLERLLTGLDPCDYSDYMQWLKLAMASHHATGGSDEGMEVFVAWSQRDPIYVDRDDETRAKWQTFKARDGNQAKLGTIFHALNKVGRGDLVDEFNRSSADEDFPDDAEAPAEAGGHWAKDWVWAGEAGQFVRRSDGRRWRPETWKSMHASKWPEGDVLNAVWKAKLPVRRFERLVYLPEQPEYPEGDASRSYNIWRKSGVEAAAGDVSVFLEHMEYLFPDEGDREHVLDYLALLVQFPARKIHFALLIRGSQGTGKSWVGQLMERIIGAPNVARPSNDEVTSRWTSWMQGAQLAILEELMTLGRREVANRLKPAITDTTLRIEEKNLPLYSIPNCLNFICFTNHSDALPIENGDRRWFVVFSPAKKREAAYYDRLFGFLDRECGAAFVKHWLLGREVKLDGRGVAPWTDGKAQMLEQSRGDLEHFLMERFEEGTAPFDFDLVRLDDVVEAVPASYRGRGSIRNRVVKFLREEIGAVVHTRYTKRGDKRPAYHLWSIRDHEHWSSVGAAGRADAFLEHKTVFSMST